MSLPGSNLAGGSTSERVVQGDRAPRSSSNHREVTPGFAIRQPISIVTKYLACNHDEWPVGDL